MNLKGVDMASERTTSEQKKSSSYDSPVEGSSGSRVGYKHLVEFLEIERKRSRAGEVTLSNYSTLDNFSLREEKLRLDILKLFIEYFCIEKRVPFKKLISSVERMIIIRALSQSGGNQKKAAQFLSMKHTTLNEKVKKYNIRIQKRII